MDKNSLVQGLARWYSEAILPRLASYGATRVLSATMVKLAETRPDLAGKLLLGKVPALSDMLDTLVVDEATFDAVVGAMRETVEKDGLRVVIPEYGLSGVLAPHDFTISADELDKIVSYARTAYANSRAATPAPAVVTK